MCYYCDILESATFNVKVLDPRAKIPSKREEDSGYDIYGIIDEDYLLIAPNTNVIIGTGLAMEFPKGLGLIVGNRGSVGTKSAVVGAHVIDSGYRGEVKIDLHNISNKNIIITDILSKEELFKCMLSKLSKVVGKFYAESAVEVILDKEPTLIPKSCALTQGMIIPTWHLPVNVVESLSESTRMEGSFGSTNKIKLKKNT
jgi:dUTP pyrophosphatase